MFSLFRDSIFYPKKIIYYRNKKGWFVFLYMLVLALLYSFCAIATSIPYKGLDYSDKAEVIDGFKGSDAYISDSIFYSSSNLYVEFDGVLFGFAKSGTQSVDDFLGSTTKSVDYVIIGSDVYGVATNLTKISYKVTTISELSQMVSNSDSIANINLANLDEDSGFFTSVNEIIAKEKPSYLTQTFFIALAVGFASILFFALITYLFVILVFKAQQYMKKAQLFKMLVFASTAIMLALSINVCVNLSYFSYLLLLVSLIPMYILEREILMRIRLFQISKGIITDPNLIEKIKEAQEKQENNDNDSDDNDDDDDNE